VLSATLRAFDAITTHPAGPVLGQATYRGRTVVVVNTPGTSPARSATNALRIVGDRSCQTGHLRGLTSGADAHHPKI
jgi:hypothetical protein